MKAVTSNAVKAVSRGVKAALGAIGPHTIEGYCLGGKPLALDARPWYIVRAVASNAQPEFAWHANKHHCTGYLSEDGKIRKLAAHVHRAAMATIDLRTHTHILHR